MQPPDNSEANVMYRGILVLMQSCLLMYFTSAGCACLSGSPSWACSFKSAHCSAAVNRGAYIIALSD